MQEPIKFDGLLTHVMKFFKLHLLIGNQEVQKLNTRSRFHSLYLQKCKRVAFEVFAGQAIRLEKLFLYL